MHYLRLCPTLIASIIPRRGYMSDFGQMLLAVTPTTALGVAFPYLIFPRCTALVVQKPGGWVGLELEQQ